jgi:XTP/dITP diphosphohydrolase/tetrapyrrole methylase family protein/MazG family protein
MADPRPLGPQRQPGSREWRQFSRALGGLNGKVEWKDFMPDMQENAPIARLRAIMHTLRSPGGCPWDQEQTHLSLLPHLIEEAYETVAAIRSGDIPHMEEELGDLLLQVVFHAELGTETGSFDFDSICEGISNKLIRRHPHVFGDASAETSEEVLRQWDQIKAAEKGDQAPPRGYLEEVGRGFPSLLRAKELQKKAAKVGFDWPSPDPVLAKVREEVEEVAAEIASGDRERLGAEIGDLLFSAVNLARHYGLDAETLLAETNDRFVRRFHGVEDILRSNGKSLGEATLEQMDAAWDAVKAADAS